MDAWEQWSALLVPHPNPLFFTGEKRLYRPSSSVSRSSFMSDGSQKRRKLTNPRQSSSPPPEIEPLSFEYDSMADVTNNFFDFFPRHDTNDDGNLMSQPRGHVQSTNTHFPHAILMSVPQSISPTIVDPNSSFVDVSLAPNAINTAIGQLESNSLFLDKSFFPNPLGFISRKLTKRRRTTRISTSASTPSIPSKATTTIDNTPSSSLTTIPNLSASKLALIPSSANPSCPPPPPVSAAIDDFHSATGVTDNAILASSTTQPQHAPQSTCSRFPAEIGNPVPASNLANPIAYTPEISSACEPRLRQEYAGRLDSPGHPHKPELTSIIPATKTELIPEPGLLAPEYIRERACSSKHSHPPGPSSRVGRLSLYEREIDLEMVKRSKSYELTAIPIASGLSGDMDSEENSNQYHNAIMHRTTDDDMEKRGILPLNQSASAVEQNSQSQDLHSNGWICVAPSLSTSPMMTTTGSSHGHGWSSSASSGELHTQDPLLTPSTSVGEEGFVGGDNPGVLMGAQQSPFGDGSKPLGSGLMSLAKWRWKRSVGSKSEEETVVNKKSNPGVNQVESDSSTVRGGDWRGESRSSEVNCEASELIPSIPTDNSSVTITQVTTFTSSLGTIAHPETGTKCPAETTVFAGTNADNIFKSVKTKTKPKFIIGDLEDGAIEFPVSNASTKVHEPVENCNTATPLLRYGRRDAINDKGSHHCGGRGWTLTSALTDEKISDAGLVKVLDRMRDDTKGQEKDGGMGLMEKVILEGWGMPDAEVYGSKDNMGNVLDKDSERGYITLCESPGNEYLSYPLQTEPSPIPNADAIDRGARPKPIKQHTRSRSTPSQAWIAAQRALLTCRELILTERHYVAQLSALAQQHTATTPPPMMCDYAKELLQACERVLKGMEKDPSARGVARAFLEREDEVQGAYIRWCGVVGGWFSGDGSAREGSAPVGRPSLDLTEVSNRVRQLSVKRRNRVASKADADKAACPIMGPEGEDGSLKRSVSTWRKSMPALSFETPGLYGGGDRKREKENEETASAPARKPAVRELAILPTQRVMRYVMIYQELLSHTPPTSPSRTLIERAAHAAARIAEKCDLAQGNAAFIASSNSNGGSSRTRNSSRTGAQLTPSRVPPLPLNLVTTERLGYDTVPASPTPTRSSVDSPSRSCFQPTNTKSNSEFMTGSRRLSTTFLSLGWGKSNKQKIPAAAESMQVHTTAGVSSITYPA